MKSILYNCCCFLMFVIVNQVASIVVTQASTDSCNPDDKKVLLQIKDHFQSVYPFSEWSPESNDCCNWAALGCRDQGRITSLIVSRAADLSSEIPKEIGDLPFLTTLVFDTLPKLSVQGRNFTGAGGGYGSFPEAITKLTKLAEISIYLTNMTGPIPDFLSQIKSLRVLQLLSNQFSGHIPSSLSSLPNLFILILSGNKLSSTIPESFGSFKTNLTLRLNGNNMLSGEIPKSLGKVNIRSLDLSYNRFTGDASFLFGRNKPLKDVVLRQNQLKFNFSNVDPPLGLKLIDIAYNQIYGSIPNQFGQLHQWNYVNMSYNRLCGRVPKGGQLKQFSPSGFAHNKCLCDAPGLPSCN